MPKPNSSAPSSAAITRSRPVRSWPSTWTRMRSRSPLATSVCCVSARPSSQGRPQCLIEVSGEAPVPPSAPEISTMSALALATPAATVPTPTSETSFTETRAAGLDDLQVEDQLGQVFDRVDVVVRRRRDQRHARRGVADAGDVAADLVARQLPALAGLGALGDLDLQLVGAAQVLERDAEARRGDLAERANGASRRWGAARRAPGPRRPRRSCCGRRGDSSRWPASRGPPC